MVNGYGTSSCVHKRFYPRVAIDASSEDGYIYANGEAGQGVDDYGARGHMHLEAHHSILDRIIRFNNGLKQGFRLDSVIEFMKVKKGATYFKPI